MLQRIITGSILVVMLIIIVALGGWVFALVATLAVCLGMREEFHALTLKGHRPVQWPTWAGMVLAIPVLLTFSYRAIVPLLLGVCFVTITVVIFRDKPSLEDAFFSLMPLLTITLPGMFLISFTQVEPKAAQVVLLALVFLPAVLNDTFALFVGSKVGGPKLCPAVSPHKTISGAIGGMAGSVLGVLLVIGIGTLTAPELSAMLPSLPVCLLLGLIGGFVGQVGDLFASLVKRHCGIKDFSNIFPGHGGMMDRMDSILFATFAVFCFRILIAV